MEKKKTVSESQLKAQKKYDSVNTMGIHLKLNKNTDIDIIEKLNSVENKQGYIKELIRKDMKSDK